MVVNNFGFQIPDFNHITYSTQFIIEECNSRNLKVEALHADLVRSLILYEQAKSANKFEIEFKKLRLDKDKDSHTAHDMIHELYNMHDQVGELLLVTFRNGLAAQGRYATLKKKENLRISEGKRKAAIRENYRATAEAKARVEKEAAELKEAKEHKHELKKRVAEEEHYVASKKARLETKVVEMKEAKERELQLKKQVADEEHHVVSKKARDEKPELASCQISTLVEADTILAKNRDTHVIHIKPFKNSAIGEAHRQDLENHARTYGNLVGVYSDAHGCYVCYDAKEPIESSVVPFLEMMEDPKQLALGRTVQNVEFILCETTKSLGGL